MTDTDTAEPAVERGAGDHPAAGRGQLRPADRGVGVHLGASGEVDGGPSVDAPGPAGGAIVLHLNDAATIYQALADEIGGTAVGWSAEALAQLEHGLLQRYGALIGGRHPVRRLVRLASRPAAR